MTLFCNFDQKRSFFEFFLDFFRNDTLQRAEISCVDFSASRRFFGAIKIQYWTIFLIFLSKGGTLMI